MPGARLRSFRLGDVAESFTGALLKRLAFVAPVPRDDDVGHDFICALSEVDGKLCKAGPSFTVQAKSNDKPIIFEKKHELGWITNQENPFFIIICDLSRESLQIFSTWNMLNAFLFKGSKTIHLIPKEPKKGNNPIQWVGAGPQLKIFLGKPILEFSSKDLLDKEKALSFAAILKEWILLDRENIVRRASKMYWVQGPRKYATNQSLAGYPFETKFYFNERNITDCVDNFVRSSAALLSVINKYSAVPMNWALFDSDMRSFLQHYSSILSPEHRRILRKFLGLKV